jgi:cell division septation protein DedD
MRKKNKRKEPEFKKPFIVLSRRKIAGWVVLIFFVCAWMFVLGILVGRGTAPVKFDIAALEKKLEVSQQGDGGHQGKAPAPDKPVTVKDKTGLEFYEALKENKVDPDVPALKKPEAVKGKIEAPDEKNVLRETKKKTAPKPNPEESASKKAGPQKPEPEASSQIKKPAKQKENVAAVVRTKATGPVYTIQAASVKDAKDADRLVQKLKKSGYPAYRAIGKIPGKGIWFRVRIGEYRSKSEARNVMNKLKKDGMKPILVMK